MKKPLRTLAFTLLITGVISSNAFATPINSTSDEKRSQSEIFYSNDKYNLTIDTQSTASDTFISWGCSITTIDLGYIRAGGLSESYVIVDNIGYTLYVDKYENGNWTTIKTFSYSITNSQRVSGFHNLSVTPKNYYRVRSTNYITDNGVTTYKTSITDATYVY